MGTPLLIRYGGTMKALFDESYKVQQAELTINPEIVLWISDTYDYNF